jgi:CHRD domain/Secretion system C-terminal sorting domain
MKKYYILVALIYFSLSASATVYNLSATLDGSQAGFPAVTATGSLVGTFNDVTNTFIYTITYQGLSSAVSAAHFHGNAAPGVGAGVKLNIGVLPSPINITVNVDETVETGFLAGLWYVNIHTTNFGGGEIRGQVTATVLAVELKDFASVSKNNYVYLLWNTVSETNNKGFQIEKSVDGKDFENIGFIKGNGNSKTQTSYSFIDKNPFKFNYYRLRQMDYDGKETVSKIVNNTFNGNNKFKIAPNPVKDNLTIYLDENEQSNMAIYDVLGRVVLTKSIFGDLSTFDISSLNTGQYIVQILSNNKSYTQQFLKY